LGADERKLHNVVRTRQYKKKVPPIVSVLINIGDQEHMKKRRVKTLGLIAGIILAVILARPTQTTIAAGLIFVIIGEAVRFWAAGHLVRKKELATSGPYAHVRDPLYFGRMFLLIGFSIMGGPWCLLVLAAGLGIFFWSYLPRKYKKEMTWLEDIFGEDYTRYAAEVHSLIPRLTPYPHSSNKSWSFKLCWHENREQYFLLIVLGIFAGMLLKYGLFSKGIL
jgi:protein-S-isoprenylcysteine O-methyltransferase Ste14